LLCDAMAGALSILDQRKPGWASPKPSIICRQNWAGSQLRPAISDIMDRIMPAIARDMVLGTTRAATATASAPPAAPSATATA
jgi:hypothetical protein